uniref:WPP domain-associated protein n=1 Tax=Kalanchoe fedtschenkoi TaxID=63787 RepID=A0A7N0T463_KALFE
MVLLNSLSMEEELSVDANWSIASSSDELGHSMAASITGSDNLGGELLEGLDSYLDDINDRLTISRMVSDSVIKGMVNAIAQDAEERIKIKELEVAKLKDSLAYYHMGEVEFDSTRLHELGCNSDEHPCGSDFMVEHDRLRHSLADLIASANDQLLRLQNDIGNMQGYVSLVRIGSGTGLVGLNGILHDQKAEKWTDADKTLESLKLTLKNVFKKVENIYHLCDSSLREWKQEQHLREEVEAMVIRQGILSLEEKIVGRSQEHDINPGRNNVDWFDSIGELSKLRRELDVISKSLSMPDNGLASHGSAEINEERNNSKRTDVFQRKTSLWEGNINHDSQIIIPENLESAQFKHMAPDQLFNFLKLEMIKMKRDHESVVHEMTEEYFSLKRRGPSLPPKKDKESDTFRKNVLEVVLKLDAILCKNENVTKLRNSVEGLDGLKRRLDNVLSENHHLKGLLINTQKEVKRLSVFSSEAQKIVSRHSVTEMNLLKKIQNLSDTIRDMHVEAAISEEINNCIFRDMAFTAQDWLKSSIESTKEREACKCFIMEPDVKDLDIEHKIMQNDLDIEHKIMQEVLGVILIEAVKSSEETAVVLHAKSARDSELQVSQQRTILEKERLLQLVSKEEERLTQELNSWKELVEEKEKMMLEVMAELSKTREDLVIVKEEVNRLREKTSAQKLLISESSSKIEDLKSKISQTLKHNRLLEAEIDELKGEHEYLLTELNKVNKERMMLLALCEDKEKVISLFVREREEHGKNIELMHALVIRLTKLISDFEREVAEDMEIKSSRLEDVATQVNFLAKKSNIQRRTSSLYKQRLEKKCLDLQKAEAEVDLLGDEVDLLLNLLEKIYIALDHYSPILKHYPGIVEILKLVRQELSGESTKPHRKHLYRGSTN